MKIVSIEMRTPIEVYCELIADEVRAHIIEKLGKHIVRLHYEHLSQHSSLSDEENKSLAAHEVAVIVAASLNSLGRVMLANAASGDSFLSEGDMKIQAHVHAYIDREIKVAQAEEQQP